MKRLLAVGTLAAVAVAVQPVTPGGVVEAQGHTVPKTQPATAPAPTPPAGEMPLGAVRLPRNVTADGKPLPAGTYQLRLTTQNASPEAGGATEGLERWVEFVQRGQVQGREVATIIPQSEISQVQKDTAPAANDSKVEVIGGGEFVRVWINRGGHHFLIYLPPAA